MYSRYFDPVARKHYPSSTTIYQVNKHHTSKRLAYFGLSIGFSKAYCHQRCKLRFAGPMSLTRLEEGKTVLAHTPLEESLVGAQKFILTNNFSIKCLEKLPFEKNHITLEKFYLKILNGNQYIDYLRFRFSNNA
jgi:hypothetical protein